ncbi:hypothetical protein KQI65_18025 [bacterium]|nr:hypothetical protein [bacterium]
MRLQTAITSLVLLLASIPAAAQPLSVSIESIDASRLPRLKMATAVRWNGAQLLSTQGRLRLYASDGTFVMEKPVTVHADGSISESLDISAVLPGSYTAVISNGDRIYVKHLMRL